MKSRKRKEYCRKTIRRCLSLGYYGDKKFITDINEIDDDYFYWKARRALMELHNGRDIIGEKVDTND